MRWWETFLENSFFFLSLLYNMSYAGASKRAQQARSGIGGPGAYTLGTSTLSNGRGGTYTMTNGSVINWGGDEKFGLYPTVGVSIGFLNILENCCQAPYPRFGVNLPLLNSNAFLM